MLCMLETLVQSSSIAWVPGHTQKGVTPECQVRSNSQAQQLMILKNKEKKAINSTHCKEIEIKSHDVYFTHT